MICLNCENIYLSTNGERHRCPLCDELTDVVRTPDDILGPSNQLGLTPREAQLEMADLIHYFALNIVKGHRANHMARPDGRGRPGDNMPPTNEALFIEAGTGTGKSLAYLSAVWEMPNLHVVVASSTKALGEQLTTKDGRLLVDKLGGRLLPVMGKGNYLCAFDHLWDDDDDAAFDLDTEDGRAANIWRMTEGGKAWKLKDDRVNNPLDTVEVCEKNTCPHVHSCAYYASRENEPLARHAPNVIVTNHAYVANRLVHARTILGETQDPVLVVIDEAHKFVEALRSASSSEVTLETLRKEPKLRDYVDVIEWPEDKGFHHLDTTAQLERYYALRSTIEELISELRSEAERASRRAGEIYIEARYAASNPGSDEREMLMQLKRARTKAKRRIRRLQQYLNVLPRVGYAALEPPVFKDEEEVEQKTTRVLKVYEDEDYARYVQDETLYCKPLNVSLPSLLTTFGKALPYYFVFCSATLTLDGSFDRFAEEVGMRVSEELCVPAPFDYKRQSFTVLCPRERAAAFTKDYRCPEPWFDVMGEHINAIYDHHAGTLRSMVLCASRADEKALTARLRAKQGGRAVILCQEAFRTRGGAGALVREYERLVAQGRSVIMLGVASLWEGVSLEGNALTSVIIPRVTFPYAGDMYNQLRSAAVSRAGRHPFTALALPYAIDNIRQGVGRLVRTVHDYGFVALLDGRIHTKRWGDDVLRNIPTAKRVTTRLERIRKVTQTWTS